MSETRCWDGLTSGNENLRARLANADHHIKRRAERADWKG
jgi:hypothetical protein